MLGGVPPGTVTHGHPDGQGGAGPGYPSAVQKAAALPAAYSPGTGFPAWSSTRPSMSVTGPPFVPIVPASTSTA